MSASGAGSTLESSRNVILEVKREKPRLDPECQCCSLTQRTAGCRRHYRFPLNHYYYHHHSKHLQRQMLF